MLKELLGPSSIDYLVDGCPLEESHELLLCRVRDELRAGELDGPVDHRGEGLRRGTDGHQICGYLQGKN